MYKKFLFFFNYALISAWILTGCQRGDTTGPEQLNDDGVHDIPQLIQRGKTTKSEIIKSFGHPAKITPIGGGAQEVWDYHFTHTDLTASSRDLIYRAPLASLLIGRSYNVKDRMLHITFEGQVVKKYQILQKEYITTIDSLAQKKRSKS